MAEQSVDHNGTSISAACAGMEGLVPALAEAMAELLKGDEYAQDTGHNIWDFAVEARLLSRLGLNSSDFRWLTCKG